ncbi:MAG: GHKL domain-containing protein [Bacteroidales bacterium]|nr:GHKL domain-containing protein [Bacteroidales bacterium]
MSKKTIWLVTFVLSATLIGLFVVQGYWIRDAIRINEQHFDQLTNNTLDNVVEQLENEEVVYQLINEVKPYEQQEEGNDTVFDYRITKTKQKKYGFNQYNLNREVLEISNVDSIDFNTYFNLSTREPLQLGLDERKYEISENLKKTFKQRLENDLKTDLSEKRVFVENIVNKLIQVDVSIENRIDKHRLDTIIREELRDKGINMNYEFAVVNKKDSTVLKTENYQPGNKDVVYSSKLFPNDVISRNNSLKLYFPERKEYIFKSTGDMTIISVILSFIVILGFAITTHIMFKQKRLSKVKNDFVNNMTHELKTPISTISLATQMLKDRSIPASSKNVGHISRIIDDETTRLSIQVEKVLKTAIFNSGRIKLKPKELDLHEIIENVVKSFYLQVENQNGKIEKELSAGNSMVKVDEVHFTNVMYNLLDNAVKYSNGKPEIKVETRNVNNSLLVAVEDNGVGIKKKDQKKIFDQFYRVPTGNLHDVKGFGLGLNYVKRMVEEHNGSINLHSENKKGSRFEIIIPINNQNKNGNRNS